MSVKMLSMLVLFGLCGSGVLLAQDSLDTRKNNKGWFQIGGGVGAGGDLPENPGSGIFSMNAAFGKNQFSLRMSRVGDIFNGFQEVGFLYSRIFSGNRAPIFISMGTGVAYVQDYGTSFRIFGGPSGSTSSYSGFGVPVQYDIIYRPINGLGLGMTVFGNINSEENFFGAAITIQAGRFWLD